MCPALFRLPGVAPRVAPRAPVRVFNEDFFRGLARGRKVGAHHLYGLLGLLELLELFELID